MFAMSRVADGHAVSTTADVVQEVLRLPQSKR
jgi:hypothetical protein